MQTARPLEFTLTFLFHGGACRNYLHAITQEMAWYPKVLKPIKVKKWAIHFLVTTSNINWPKHWFEKGFPIWNNPHFSTVYFTPMWKGKRPHVTSNTKSYMMYIRFYRINCIHWEQNTNVYFQINIYEPVSTSCTFGGMSTPSGSLGMCSCFAGLR